MFLKFLHTIVHTLLFIKINYDSKQCILKFQEVSNECYGQSMWSPGGPNGKRTLGCYCFDLSHSIFCEGNMRAVNIGVPSDVGDWLCQQLREELCACDTANQLEAYFKKSCSKI